MSEYDGEKGVFKWKVNKMKDKHYENSLFRVIFYNGKWAIFDEWNGKMLAFADNPETANELAKILAKCENREFVAYEKCA